MNRLRHFIISLLLTLATALGLAAQTPDPSQISVGIVTCYPGTKIFELEGHSALHIVSPGGDYAVSYGLFSFDQPNFVYRFVKGETDYRVGLIPWHCFLQEYRGAGRRVVEQRLNMTPEQKQRLMALLEENLRRENVTYRYNYVRDNCATRPLAIVEKALGDSIILSADTASGVGDEDATFRNMMRRYHRNYPWYQFGIDLCLGPGIDARLNNRERAFAPVVMDSQLAGATVGGKPLVDSTIVINDTDPEAAVAPPTPWYLTPLCAFSLLLLISLIITIRDIRRGRVTRWFDTVLFGAYALMGVIVFYLVTISSNEATTPNWLLVSLNPLCLIAAVGEWIKRAEKLVVWYQIINFALLLLLVLCWGLTGQSANAAFWPMIAAEMLRSASYVIINRKHTPRNDNKIDKKKRT